MSTSKLIDGKAASARVMKQVREDVDRLRADSIFPALAVILVGQDPASQVYVRNKILRAEEAGIKSLEYRLSEETSQEELLKLIADLNADKAVNGILLQLPSPSTLKKRAPYRLLPPART